MLPSSAGVDRRHPLYHTWWSMWLRCEYPATNSYSSYGGRGIRVSPRWKKFDTFLADMGPRPDGHTLDRIDSDWHYLPTNCQWVPAERNIRRKKRDNR